jgi:hypothetical protein
MLSPTEKIRKHVLGTNHTEKEKINKNNTILANGDIETLWIMEFWPSEYLEFNIVPVICPNEDEMDRQSRNIDNSGLGCDQETMAIIEN